MIALDSKRLPVWQAHEEPSWQVTADMGPDDKRRLIISDLNAARRADMVR